MLFCTVGMTKVKFSKSEENNTFFLERRRAALERLAWHPCHHFVSCWWYDDFHAWLLCRYLNRLAKHPILRKDEDFKDFLENPNDVSKLFFLYR